MSIANNGLIRLFTGIVYLCLFSFALLFYFERLNSDAGYYFFHTVNTRGFHVEHGRLVLILAELLPALGSIMHLPLKILAILYSLNHVLFPAILTAICITKYRHTNAAFLITVMQFAGLKYAVFTPQFELFYGLSLLVFTLSYIQYISESKQKWTVANYTILCALLVFVFTSHPMAVYCYFACVALFLFAKKNWNILLVSIALLVAYALWKYLFISDYEASKFANFNAQFNNPFGPLWMNFHFFKPALTFLFRHYPDILLLLFAGIVHFIINSQFRKLALYLLFITVSLIIIWLMFPPANMGRYIEQVYFPFVFVTLSWLFKCRLNRFMFCFVFFAFLYRAYLIIDTAKDYRERAHQIALFTEKAQQQAGSKFYVTKAEMGAEMYEKGNWSYGFETLIYSAMNDSKTVTITKLEDLEYQHNKEHLKPSDFLFRPFDIVPMQSLNQQYFRLTEGEYLLLGTSK